MSTSQKRIYREGNGEREGKKKHAEDANKPGPFSLTIATPSSLFSKFSKYSNVLPPAAEADEKLLRECVTRDTLLLRPPLNITPISPEKKILE